MQLLTSLLLELNDRVSWVDVIILIALIAVLFLIKAIWKWREPDTDDSPYDDYDSHLNDNF